MDEEDKPGTPADGQSLAVVILGNDAVVAAHPGTPAQLANACRAAGFDLVIPPAWGDEIVAASYLEQLAGQREVAIIGCACPRVTALLEHAPNLTPLRCVSIAAPPVVAARSLRAVHGDGIVITYVGGCSGATDPAIDIQFSPADLFSVFERQGVTVADQSAELDTRELELWQRHYSVPGGLPALRFLARSPVERVLRSIDAPALAHGRIRPSRSNVLVDLAEAAGCVCGGARDHIEECEPPRRAEPVVTRPAGVTVDPLRTVRPPRVVRLHGPARDLVVDIEDPEIQDEVAQAATPLASGVRDPSPPRAFTMAAAPAVVLVLVAALGVAVYASSSSGEPRAAASSPATERAGRDDTRHDGGTDAPGRRAAPPTTPRVVAPQASDVPVAESPLPRPAATAAALRAGGMATQDGVTEAPARDSVARGNAERVAPRRRPGKTATVEVVPGWMPQGLPKFAPIDSAARTPERPPKPRATADTTRPPT